MAILLDPYIEEVARRDAETLGFGSVEEYVHSRLTAAHAEQALWGDDLAQIRADIEEGWQEAQRGDVLTEAESRAELNAMKLEWRAGRER